MIKVKVIEDESGHYLNSLGKHYNIIACSWVKGPRADEFKEFNSLEEAMEAYGLTEVEVE